MGHEFISPLRRWEVLAGLCESIKAKTFVEVGCKEGRTTGFILDAIPDIRVIAIDPWYPVANSAEDYKDWDYKAIEDEFWKNVGEHKDRCTMMRCKSDEAASAWCEEPPTLLAPRNSMDIVFIDAGHDYESCKADIELWWPKVREGGYLTGHDLQHKFPGVMRAVAEKFPLLEVTVFPDSVWCVQKREGLMKVAA